MGNYFENQGITVQFKLNTQFALNLATSTFFKANMENDNLLLLLFITICRSYGKGHAHIRYPEFHMVIIKLVFCFF